MCSPVGTDAAMGFSVKIGTPACEQFGHQLTVPVERLRGHDAVELFVLDELRATFVGARDAVAAGGGLAQGGEKLRAGYDLALLAQTGVITEVRGLAHAADADKTDPEAWGGGGHETTAFITWRGPFGNSRCGPSSSN